MTEANDLAVQHVHDAADDAPISNEQSVTLAAPTSSLDCHLSDARIVEGGSARNRSVNNFTKVTLGSFEIPNLQRASALTRLPKVIRHLYSEPRLWT